MFKMWKLYPTKEEDMKLSQLTLIESQIGFTSGILVGALGSWVFIIFFTNMEWWVKVLSSIGEVGIVGSLLLSLKGTIEVRRSYLDAQNIMQAQNVKGGRK